MKIKTLLTLLGIWLSISSVVAFMVTSSIIYGQRSEQNYKDLLSKAVNVHHTSVRFELLSLENRFSALLESVSVMSQMTTTSEAAALFRRDFIASYAKNRENILYAGINGLYEFEFAEYREASDEIISQIFGANAMERDYGRVYLLPFENAPTREFGLVISGVIELVPTTNDESSEEIENRRRIDGEATDEIDENREILTIVFSPESLLNIIENAELPADGRLILTDPNDNHIERGRFVNEFTQSRHEHKEVRSFSTIETPEVFDDATLWLVNMTGDVREIRDIASDALGRLLFLTIALCVVGIVLSLLVTKRLYNPLTHIAETLSLFRRGDVNVRIKIKSRDERNEFGEISRQFNEFAGVVTGKNESGEIVQSSESKSKLKLSEISLDALTGAYSKTSIEAMIAKLACPKAAKIETQDNSDGNNIEETEKLRSPEPSKVPSVSEATQFIPFVVMYVKPKNLQELQAQHSFASGELALTFTARVLRMAIGEQGKIGRYEYDAFIVVLKASSLHLANAISAKVAKHLKKGYKEESGIKISIEAEIGMSAVTDTPFEVDEIIQRAKKEIDA
ncbi:MAG: diguanylate cyclase [Oscillospiraceae bacterium]|nr:diguanylate cyclase [Oscillospiraceae bacterium]